MDLSLSDFLLEEQWHPCVILHVYIVHSFGWQVVLEYMTCLWKAFTSVRSQVVIISAQLFVRVKTCHHFLHEYKWLHECQGCKMRISTGSKWCWTSDFSACDIDCTNISSRPHRVFGATVITNLNLLCLWSSSLKMKLGCTAVLFFFFKAPWWPRPLFGVPQWPWI